MAIITLNNNSLSSVTSLPAGVGGKVLQVVHSSTSTGASTSATTLIDTNLSGTITPSSTSSKILVIVNHADNDKNLGDCNQRIHLFRGTTFLLEFARNLNNTGDSTEQRTESGCSYLDSPSTTSATTYSLKVGGNGSTTIYINRSGRDSNNTNEDGRYASTITLMEIAG